MTYTFRCESCGNRNAEERRVDDRDLPGACLKCHAPTRRDFGADARSSAIQVSRFFAGVTRQEMIDAVYGSHEDQQRSARTYEEVGPKLKRPTYNSLKQAREMLNGAT